MRGMRHRLMMGRYEKIDYISSTGHVNNNINPYIDTKCVLSSDFTFKISYMVLSDNSAFMFGGRTAYNSNDEFAASTTYLNIGLSLRNPIYTRLHKKFILEATPSYYSVAGKKTIIDSKFSKGEYPIWLFCTNTKGTGLYQPGDSVRIYYLKIYNNGILVRDFIPVRRKSDGKIGLLDKVESKFYTSPNGAKFIGG